MTRVLLMSDLHIEFGPLTVPQTDVDVAILAGDIHVGSARSHPQNQPRLSKSRYADEYVRLAR
jgi:hypothetical protein